MHVEKLIKKIFFFLGGGKRGKQENRMKISSTTKKTTTVHRGRFLKILCILSLSPSLSVKSFGFSFSQNFSKWRFSPFSKASAFFEREKDRGVKFNFVKTFPEIFRKRDKTKSLGFYFNFFSFVFPSPHETTATSERKTTYLLFFAFHFILIHNKTNNK